MNIQRNIVTSKNWDAGRGGKKITGIVLHTMVGSPAGAFARFNNPASEVSVHYGVGLNGQVYQWVDEANTAWQAGNYAINQSTIGIEHDDAGNANDAKRTDALYQSSAALVADICKRYGIPCDTGHIYKHKDVIDTSRYPGGTACPDALDTNRIIAMANQILKGGDMTKLDEEGARILAVTMLGRNIGSGPTPPDILNHVGGDALAKIKEFYYCPEGKAWSAKLAAIEAGPTAVVNDVEAALAKYKVAQ